MTNFEKVGTFMKTFGQEVKQSSSFSTEKINKLRVSLIKDWFFFLFTILVINSIFYSILVVFFNVKIDYYNLLFNVLYTFLFYYFFSYIFGYYLNLLRRTND